MNIICWFDGACEPVNPGGTASWGIVVKDEDDLIHFSSGIVGQGAGMSNNVAEYAALIALFNYILSMDADIKIALIYGDSQLVIRQMRGEFKVRGGLYVSYYHQAKELADRLRSLGVALDFEWIPREQNIQCDKISRSVLPSAPAGHKRGPTVLASDEDAGGPL